MGSEELRFDEQVVIISGAGRGLGRSHALLLAARGARVVVNDLDGDEIGGGGDGSNADVATRTVEEIRAAGGEAIAACSDVVTGADQIVERALQEWGRIDAVVNNAGIVGSGHFTDRAAADFEALLNVHVLGTVNLTRAAWPHLSAVRGRVVNTTSGAVVGLPGNTDYAAAKGGVLGFTRGLAIDGRRDGVRVNAIMPMAHTRMYAAAGGTPGSDEEAALRHLMPPESVSPVVAWLAHESVQCTGEVFETAGGYASRLVLGFGPATAGRSPEDFAAQCETLVHSPAVSSPADLTELLGARFALLSGPDGRPERPLDELKGEH